MTDDGRLVGLAIYLRAEDELRVPELGVSATSSAGAHDVLNVLFDALETACLAGGHRRLIVTPPATALAMLQRRGYTLIREGCAGTWSKRSLRTDATSQSVHEHLGPFTNNLGPFRTICVRSRTISVRSERSRSVPNDLGARFRTIRVRSERSAFVPKMSH